MSWADHARATIARVHEGLAVDATLIERTAAVDAAYPFGERAHFPYKAWLKARRAYLGQYGHRPRGQTGETLLDRMMAAPK